MPRRSVHTKPMQSGGSPHDEVAFPFGALTAPIAERIRAEGISTCREWVTLGLKRFRIFGVVSKQVHRIDEIVRLALAEAQAARVEELIE